MRSVLLTVLLAATPAAAQTLVADLWPGPASSDATPIGRAGDRLVVAALTPQGLGLFAVGGTSVARLASADRVFYGGAEADGTLYLFLGEGRGGDLDLWRTDGTPGGTVRVADLPAADRVGYPVVTEGRLFFLLRPSGGAAPVGTELWTSDGTAAGTRPVEGARPRVNDGLAYVVTATGGRVFYSAGDGTVLGSSDGAEVGPAIAFGPAERGGGFFYGTALGVGGRVFALAPEAQTPGLYLVGEGGPSLVGEVALQTPNRTTLAALGDGVLFEARAPEDPGGAVTYYASYGRGLERVSPAFPLGTFDDRAAVSPLADGSVALAVQGARGAEVWRVAPGGAAAPAFALPEGEAPFARFGLFETAREDRPAPAVVLADGALHALTVREEGGADGDVRATYALWRDAGDGTARLLARYGPTDPNDAPVFTSAGGTVYVSFSTPETGRELFSLGSVATAAAPPAPEARLTLSLVGPNPARHRVGLVVDAPSGEAVRVEVFDGVGRRVTVLHAGSAVGRPLSFDVAGLAPGTYSIRAVAAGASAVRRITVVR